jgi:hypothetical protein
MDCSRPIAVACGYARAPLAAGHSVRMLSVGLILTGAAGLCLWIVVWALGVSGFDAILIAVVMVVVSIGIRNLLPFLPGRQD